MSCCEGCGALPDKRLVVAGITCPHCSTLAWSPDMCPKKAGVTWHHPACPVVAEPVYAAGNDHFWHALTLGALFAAAGEPAPPSPTVYTGDCDWTHPWDCVTSAWDAIRDNVPGAEYLEDFANSAVGKAFFAFVSPSILAGLVSSAPAVGAQLAVVMANPVVYNALPGLARGERVDHAFIASAKAVAQRLLSSGAGQAEIADQVGKATDAAKAALAQVGTSPEAEEAYATSLRVQAGLRTAEQELPPELQAQLDKRMAALKSKLPDVHTLAQRAGVADDVMQTALDGVTRTIGYDPSKFDSNGRLLMSNVNANALGSNVIRDLDANFTAQALKPLLQWRYIQASETPREIAQYFRAHPDFITFPGKLIPLYVASMVPRATAAILNVSEDQATENITQALLRSGMHPVVKMAGPGQLGQLAATFFGTPAPAVPVQALAPPSGNPWDSWTMDQWIAYYTLG